MSLLRRRNVMIILMVIVFCFIKQKTAYEMRISDWSSDVCSSDLALVAAVDHGPLAPSISIARMAATCGVGLNSAMASAINVLGDVHGGAGQECLTIYAAVDDRQQAGMAIPDAVQQIGRAACRERVCQYV